MIKRDATFESSPTNSNTSTVKSIKHEILSQNLSMISQQLRNIADAVGAQIQTIDDQGMQSPQTSRESFIESQSQELFESQFEQVNDENAFGMQNYYPQPQRHSNQFFQAQPLETMQISNIPNAINAQKKRALMEIEPEQPKRTKIRKSLPSEQLSSVGIKLYERAYRRMTISNANGLETVEPSDSKIPVSERRQSWITKTQNSY